MAEEPPIHLPLGTFHKSAGQNYRMSDAEAMFGCPIRDGEDMSSDKTQEKFRVNIMDDVTDIR
jgi:hypothetical protein